MKWNTPALPNNVRLNKKNTNLRPSGSASNPLPFLTRQQLAKREESRNGTYIPKAYLVCLRYLPEIVSWRADICSLVHPRSCNSTWQRTSVRTFKIRLFKRTPSYGELGFLLIGRLYEKSCMIKHIDNFIYTPTATGTISLWHSDKPPPV